MTNINFPGKKYLIRPAWRSCVINLEFKKCEPLMTYPKKYWNVNYLFTQPTFCNLANKLHLSAINDSVGVLALHKACIWNNISRNAVCVSTFFCSWNVDTWLNRPSCACLPSWQTHRTWLCRHPAASLSCLSCYRTTRPTCPRQLQPGSPNWRAG